ncbi:EAL domain-containing protein [Armatimonas sp.]|uniref:EAL domain-containing protein n=1 Tax=Armatimonas sp. TaxID=1872638 RepID=UPI00286CCE84|nr:EAL domain-containing protein [Armatimonas sp.]
MSFLSAERLGELLGRLLTATRSFAYTAHYDAQARQLAPPTIADPRRACDLLPLDNPEQLSFGDRLLAAVPAEERQRRQDVFQDAFTSQQREVNVRFRCIDTSGKTYWIHEEATLESGNIIGVFAVLPVVEEAPLLAEPAPGPISTRPRLLKRSSDLTASDLEAGLKKQQFILAYQFQLQPQQQRITGVEAFIRWRHPEQGLLFPSRFLSLAEESGLIEALGLWMAESAYHQQRVWQDSGYDIPLCLNIAGRQLLQTGFSQKLPAGNFRFELTENTLLQHGEALRESLLALSKRGFPIGLDNVGTGNITDATLMRFPLRYLKIARSLVQNLDVEESAEKVQWIIALGRAHGLEVTADGVETHQEAQQLLAAGCTALQGYLYSRPIGAEALEELLRSGNYLLPERPLARAA